jgi:L-seryl-tRNA(Ser) seleniumtransferase
MSNRDSLRLLPGIHQLKQDPTLVGLLAELPDDLVARALRETVEALRQELLAQGAGELPVVQGKLAPDFVAGRVRTTLARLLAPSLVPVFNGSGVIIHTNLGRAPLGLDIWHQMSRVATGYSNLEYDLGAGARGSRHQHLESVLQRLLGAPACLVVNNNAAAVLLVLTALARGREVLISRSELVEIGGSFRIPDIMAQGGAILREVGTTNRTWLKDYQGALGPDTGLLMKAHRSNFSLTGFVTEVSREELVDLGRQSNLPYYEDLGSGLIADLHPAGISDHDQVKRVLAAGVDLVSFSGDKMFGGPQAGIIAGRPDLIQQLKQHPLTRALRPDKVTLAGLEAVALAYLRGDEATAVPVVAMLREPLAQVRRRAQFVARKLRRLPGIEVTVVATQAKVGGGAEPGHTLPSAGLSITCAETSETRLEAHLRGLPVPIIARIEEGKIILDMRTILPHQQADFTAALTKGLAPLTLP